MIKGPPVTDDFPGGGTHRIIQAEDGAVGFAMMYYPHFQTWQRNVDAHGVATWVPWKTVELRNILGPRPQIGRTRRMARLTRGWDYVKGTGGIMCYVEDTDVIFIHMDVNVYMIQLNSLQSKSIPGKRFRSAYHPFMSFYTPGNCLSLVLILYELPNSVMFHKWLLKHLNSISEVTGNLSLISNYPFDR